MNKSNLIIDSHSHIGKDYFWRNSSLDEYIQLLVNQNIDIGLLMPAPGHVLLTNYQQRYLIWKEENKKIEYYTEDLSNNLTNPYLKLNDHYFNVIKNHVANIKLYYIPLINPLFDTEEYLIELKKKYDPIALKIHGVACGIGPLDIKKRITETFKSLKLPIIVHTDYSNEIKNALDKIRVLNNSYDWAIYFLENGIKGYLTHGARLDFDTFKLVNSNKNLVIGIGPDLKINKERFRWKTNICNKEYLHILKESLEIDKIIFDLDYSWNLDENNNIDYSAIDRTKKIFTSQESQLILGKNAINFFERI